jgi:hypothetical protein
MDKGGFRGALCVSSTSRLFSVMSLSRSLNPAQIRPSSESDSFFIGECVRCVRFRRQNIDRGRGMLPVTTSWHSRMAFRTSSYSSLSNRTGSQRIGCLLYIGHCGTAAYGRQDDIPTFSAS